MTIVFPSSQGTGYVINKTQSEGMLTKATLTEANSAIRKINAITKTDIENACWECYVNLNVMRTITA